MAGAPVVGVMFTVGVGAIVPVAEGAGVGVGVAKPTSPVGVGEMAGVAVGGAAVPAGVEVGEIAGVGVREPAGVGVDAGTVGVGVAGELPTAGVGVGDPAGGAVGVTGMIVGVRAAAAVGVGVNVGVGATAAGSVGDLSWQASARTKDVVVTVARTRRRLFRARRSLEPVNDMEGEYVVDVSVTTGSRRGNLGRIGPSCRPATAPPQYRYASSSGR